MNDIAVEIYGQTYRIRGDLDPVYLKQLAATVDEKMRVLSRDTGAIDTRRLAVLTALNLADEVEELQRKLAAQASATLPAQFGRRVEECTRLLETTLGQTPR